MSRYPFVFLILHNFSLTNCFSYGSFQEEGTPLVSKFITDVSKKEELDLTIKSFKRWKLGDGDGAK